MRCRENKSGITFALSPAQRTALKQRPHQETPTCQVATSEPVVVHHGREGRRCRSRRVAAVGAAACLNGLLGGLRKGVRRLVGTHVMLRNPGLGHGFEGSTLVREPGIFQVETAQGRFEMTKGTTAAKTPAELRHRFVV